MLQEGMTCWTPQTLQQTLADGQAMGEIMFRGNIVMKGYLKNPGTAQAFAGGWFHTGDLAVMEPDRYVKIKDRSKDIIISGGETSAVLEVEDALYRHPAVLACAVVARPDERWGETPVAFVECKPGAAVTAAELVAHCKALLAGYKVPRDVRFEPLPKTSTGKIQKFQLRERARSPPAASKGKQHEPVRQRSLAQQPGRPRRADADAEPATRLQCIERRLAARVATGAGPCSHDQTLRVLVLGAAGKAFCAGHDLKEMRAEPAIGYYQALFAECSRVMMAIQQLPCRSLHACRAWLPPPAASWWRNVTWRWLRATRVSPSVG
jgi:hypothetical protein